MSFCVSYKLRANFFANDGKEFLQESHQRVGTVMSRIFNGVYNDGVHIFSKSFRSAAGQMVSRLAELNVGKGFIKDWLIQLLQFAFSSSLLKGLKNLKW